MRKALVILHLSTIDSYAWNVGEKKAKALAGRLIRAICTHRGPVYIVDQFWDGPLREQIAAERSNHTPPMTTSVTCL
jgi:hypothetical protein